MANKKGKKLPFSVAQAIAQRFANKQTAFGEDPRITEIASVGNSRRLGRRKIMLDAIVRSGPWTYGGGPAEGNLPGQTAEQVWPVTVVRGKGRKSNRIRTIASEDRGIGRMLNELPDRFPPLSPVAPNSGGTPVERTSIKNAAKRRLKKNA